MAGHLTLEEQELVIIMSGRTDIVKVYASYPHWIKRLDKYCEEEPDNWKCVKTDTIDGDVVGRFYEAPRDLLKLQKRKRQISEAQKKASAERLAKYRNAVSEEDEPESEPENE